MTTRRTILQGGAGLAAILASGKAPAVFIKSMLAARNSIVTQSGGVKLPYDAEVEYLESTGTQYIDTGLKLRTADTVAVTCYVNSDVTTNWYGVLGSYDGAKYFILRCFSRDSGRMNWLAEDSVTFDANRYEWITTSHTLTSNSGVAYESLVDAYLFAYNTRGSLSSKIAYRISAFSVTRDGVKILDFIPVRFTNELGQSEGAMMDTLTRRIYRNVGTGAFLFGADKKDSPPLAYNSYIKDGLIAMWDGEHDNDVSMADKLAPYISQMLSAREARAFSVSVAGDVAFPSVNPFNTSDGTGNFGRVTNVNTGTLLIYCGSSQGTQLSIGAAPKSVSLVVDGGVWTCYANDSGGSLVSVSRTAVPETTTGWSMSNIQMSNQTYKNIRIYNRALTAEEIAANYAVDKQRFNLP